MSAPSFSLREPSPEPSGSDASMGVPLVASTDGTGRRSVFLPADLDNHQTHGPAASPRVPLVCTCRLSLRRNGEPLTVVAHLWDCPSHGRDKRRALADMCSVASPSAMWTFTLPQPHAVDEDGCPVIPTVFQGCDWHSHVYTYRDGTLRWRTLSTCSRCCARVSRMMDTLTKWIRRRYPQAQRLWVREEHKSGALHIHSAWSGVPFVARKSRAANRIREHWTRLGGGFIDFGKRDSKDPRWMGWYIGKYLAKSHDRPMARGYRRWSRSGGFAPVIRMPRYVPDPDREPGRVEILGWLDPFSREVKLTRTFLPT